MEDILAKIEEKEWVINEDEWIEINPIYREMIEDGIEPYMYEFQWKTNSFIPHCNIQEAIKDDDVVVCDINAEDDGTPIVNLEWVGEGKEEPFEELEKRKHGMEP